MSEPPSHAAEPPPPAVQAPERTAELEAYLRAWSVVQNDPSDFPGWTSLISTAEKLDDIEKIRAVYDHFFVEFPLCYGYWKKYADCEARHSTPEAALAVFERGVLATPYSGDLWGHYAAYKKSVSGSTPEEIRGIYERGIAYCGQDYSSSSLWDKYFMYEQEQGSSLHIVSLYTRVLACPTKELERYYTSFRAYAQTLTSDKLMTAEEYSALRDQLYHDKMAELTREREAAAAAAAAAAAKAEAAAVKTEPSSKTEAELSSPSIKPDPEPETVSSEAKEEACADVAAAAPAASDTVNMDTDVPMSDAPDVSASEKQEAAVTEAETTPAAEAAAPALEAGVPAAGDAQPCTAAEQEVGPAEQEVGPAAAEETSAQVNADAEPAPDAAPAVDAEAGDAVPAVHAAAAEAAQAGPAAGAVEDTPQAAPEELTGGVSAPAAPVGGDDVVMADTDTAPDAAAPQVAQPEPAGDAATVADPEAAAPEVKPEAAAAAAAATDMDEDVPPGTEALAAPSAEPAAADDKQAAPADVPAEAPAVFVSEEEVRLAFLRIRDEYHALARRELMARKPYEDGIRRPYFHVKPLDAMQLFNWCRYLDFMESRGDQTASIMLYERCLVACASYPEFWMRYVRFMEQSDRAAAKSALDRAVLVYCKRRPEMHLFAAAFDERGGDVESGRARFRHILEVMSPRLLEGITAAANFERRRGARDAACKYFDDLLQEERAKDHSKLLPFLASHYAQFLYRSYSDLDAARKVLDDALQLRPEVRALWEAALHLEEQVGTPAAVSRALELYDKCTAQPLDPNRALPDKEREELSMRSLEYADMACSDPNIIASIALRHSQRFMLPLTVTGEARAASKRAAEAVAAPVNKAPRVEYSPVPAVPQAAAVPPAMPGAMPPAPPAAGAAPAAYPPAAYSYPYAYPGYGYGGYGYGY